MGETNFTLGPISKSILFCFYNGFYNCLLSPRIWGVRAWRVYICVNSIRYFCWNPSAPTQSFKPPSFKVLSFVFNCTTILQGCSFHPHGHQHHRSKKLYLCQFYLIFLLEFHHPKIFHLCSIVCWNYFPCLHHHHHLNFYICVNSIIYFCWNPSPPNHHHHPSKIFYLFSFVIDLSVGNTFLPLILIVIIQSVYICVNSILYFCWNPPPGQFFFFFQCGLTRPFEVRFHFLTWVLESTDQAWAI